MPRAKKSAADATAPVPVRLSKRLRDEIKRVSDERDIQQQDLIRLAAEVGLKVLAKTDFDQAEAIARYAFELSGEDREQIEREKVAMDAPGAVEPLPEHVKNMLSMNSVEVAGLREALTELRIKYAKLTETAPHVGQRGVIARKMVEIENEIKRLTGGGEPITPDMLNALIHQAPKKFAQHHRDEEKKSGTAV